MSNWDLIDWPLVGRSTLWIVGLSVALAAVSFGDFQAGDQRRPLRDVLRGKGYQRAINGGLTLVCLGMLFGSGHWWEVVTWAILCVGFVYLAWQAS